jgi:hypothetical protein
MPTVATMTGASSTAFSSGHSSSQAVPRTSPTAPAEAIATRDSDIVSSVAPSYPRGVAATNYSSGEDYVVEFLGYRFGFGAEDFEERVTAAVVRLGLVSDNDLDAEETADLVELAADGVIEEPRSELGRYLVRHWERVSLVSGESLVYWVRKLVFRGAWLDHRVKEGLLEVAWDDDAADFAYRDPRGGRALLELAPVPSWQEVQYRR